MKKQLTLAITLLSFIGFSQIASFSTIPSAVNGIISICQGNAIYYTNTSTGTNNQTNYNWTFQGGNPINANLVGPHNVTYNTAGNYTTTLNLGGGNTATVNVVVTNNAAPQAVLTMTNNGNYSSIVYNGATIFRKCGGNSIGNFNFTDPNMASNPAGTTYLISWGDNTTSTIPAGAAPQWPHSFTGQGNYTLSYTVTFPGGCTTTSTYQVYVGNFAPAITLAGSGSSSCLPNNYSFTLGTGNTTPSIGTTFQVIYNDGSPVTIINGLGANNLDTIFHQFTNTSCGVNSTIQTTVYQNAYAIQVLASNVCSPQGTYGAIGPISVAGSVNANINAIPMTNTICVNSPMTFQDVSNPGSNVSSGSCDSLYGHYWTITPNSGYTLGAGATLGSSNGFVPNSQFGYDWQSWTLGPLQLPVTWTTPGTYQVTLFAGNDCGMDSTVYNISVNGISAGQNQTICAGTAVTLTGSGSQSYTWTNGITNGVPFIPMSTQTYTVTGTNSNGCLGNWNNTSQVTVTVNPLPSVSGGPSQTVCAGTAVTLNGSGATSYMWNNGVTNAVAFTPLSTQTYTVSGTNANGCVNTAQATITVNQLPTVSAGANQSVCAGTAVTLNGSGASSYVWNNGVTNAIAFIPVSTQTYTVSGTNANGCVNTAQATITVNPLPTVSAGANQAVCIGTAVTLNGSGATSYVWNNGVTNAVVFTPLTTQTYTVTGTNANGCVNTAQATITVNSLPTVSAGANQMVCAGTAVTLNGSGASSYSWNNGVTNAVAFTPLTTQTYTVTGINANGCINTAQATITINSLPTVSAGANQTVCAGTAVTLNGSGASSYVWNGGVTNAVAFTPVSTQTYTVTGINANGCVNSAQATITVISPMVSGGANQSVCAGTAVTLNGSGASSYAWNNGVTNAVAFTPVSSQTYTLIGTDANGCTGSDTVVVSVLENAASSLTQTALDFYTLNGQTYNQSGTYTQVIPSANGCDSTITLNLTLNFTGIHELGTATKILVKITDLNGKTIPRRKNTVMLFIYEDGTVERVVEME
jgi:hypothetical protein